MIYATGVGMSFIAAQRFAYLARAFGVPSVAYHAADWGHGQGNVRPDDWLVGFSYSGKTPETIAALNATKLSPERKVLFSSAEVDGDFGVEFLDEIDYEHYPRDSLSIMMTTSDEWLERWCENHGIDWKSNYAEGHPSGVWGKNDG